MNKSHLPTFSITLIILFSGCLDESSDSGFWGTELSPPVPTPDFQLTNQYNDSVNLTTFKGNVLIVTFIFTHCTDTCLPITYLLKNLSIMLGSEFESNVSFLSISTDPERDTPEMLSIYTSQNNVSWSHLTGSRDSLKSVWDDFGVWVVPQNSGSRHNDTHPDEDYNVIHNPVVFILDKDLRKRSLFTGVDWYPDYLLHDIEIILQEDWDPSVGYP